LDLRKASEASVAEVRRIGNVNVAIYTAETAALLARLKIGNLNTSVEVPVDVAVKTSTGQLVINRHYFSHTAAPFFLLAIGQTIFEPDVSGEDIEKGLYGFVAIGQLLCPETLLGAVQAKSTQIIGQTKTYPALKQVMINSAVLDEKTLAGMEDASELAVIGSLKAPEVLPDGLLAQKLNKLYVTGEVTCHAENAQAFQVRLMKGSGNVKIIPSGFEWVDGNLHLDNSMLEMWSAKKLYCDGRVVVDSSVTPEALEQGLDALICENTIFVPQALKNVMKTKVDLLKSKVIFYEGELWLVDGESSLPASRFDYLEGKISVVVDGVLTVDGDVEAKLLADRIAKVHNYGVMRCTPAQMGALQARLGVHEGVIESAAQAKGVEENGSDIGNANFLAL
jgi:hypothetical protein